MIDWPVGLSTGCFYRTPLLDCLEAIRSSGFGLVEICSYPAHLDYRDRHAVEMARARLQALGMEAYSFHAPFAEDIDITSFDPAQRERALRELVLAAEAAARLQVRYFVIHPGPERGGVPDEERLARMRHAASVLERAADRCRDLGVGFVLENQLPHLFFGHARDLLWLMGTLERTDVGICLDTGHAQLSGDLHTVVHKLSGHLWMLHASDTRGHLDDHLPPGRGGIPWGELVDQLYDVGFRGALIMEIAATDHPDTALHWAREGRLFLRDTFRRKDRIRMGRTTA
ncbi:MAG TPA: sugar phosphate isomerase/epimerase family protein [Candidatus Polarisedimenticolaceae bacterium]|nr:sugar phosphate isomerase/epimerase family protein [Candidatus Polarisedimenticolaceae bacterium]